MTTEINLRMNTQILNLSINEETLMNFEESAYCKTQEQVKLLEKLIVNCQAELRVLINKINSE
jgi:hypothetical protein